MAIGAVVNAWPQEGSLWFHSAAPTDIVAKERALARVCQEHGVSLPEAAISFPFRHPAVACVVPGIRTAAQARECAAYMAARVPEEAWGSLDEVAATF